MEYNFREIEQKWQQFWKDNGVYRVTENESKPKFYVLDMFPYPSGAGLHVGHPLGYIASDIYSRFKRLQGFNVLHPMGYDAYGLPAEQYAIQTGQHPAITTKINIARYREQLDKIGFCYDWDREVRTCEPDYYKWTQWAFIQMFNHYYDKTAEKALSIESLVKAFETSGTEGVNASCSEELTFTAEEWKAKTEKEQQEILLNYRIAYLADLSVNWCPKLGTVLANDEVSEGLSVRGGYPVEQRMMRQWSLRVSAYAQRLLDGLTTVDWSDSLKETQKNWIGRSEGAEMKFAVKGQDIELEIFTTRADTIYGVTFMVMAPESDYVNILVTDEHRSAVDAYLAETKKRTERDRIADRRVTGVFSGAYAINPFSGAEIPVYISDYVLAGYGTGAIMAVPAHDSRDYAFAKHFNLPIIPLIEGCDVSEESFDAKEGIMVNSGFLNGLTVKEAIAKTKEYISEKGIGKVKTNFRLRDAIFSRQRYWGEPFPVYYKEGLPYMLDESKLPLELPEIDKYLPTEDGQPPLGRAKGWQTEDGYQLELNTMPGFAGSSAYYLRYMDPKNENALVSEKNNQYWRNVDLYIGGTEHATGHLIYSRFWNKFLFDLGIVCEEEPFKKLVNQGMIQGRSNFVYKLLFPADKDESMYDSTRTIYISANLVEDIKRNSLHPISIFDKIDWKSNFNSDEVLGMFERCFSIKTSPGIHTNVNFVSNNILDIENAKNAKNEIIIAGETDLKNAIFIGEDWTENGTYICGDAVEKMSKSYLNVVNPDVIVEKYGADTLRFYEMFLGPLEQSKPWDTNGIDGVHRFLKKLWNLFLNLTDGEPTKEELKSLHKLIKKVSGDIETFSFNTSVSAFMICVNELTSAKYSKKAILKDLVVLLAPFAPHIAEELWHLLGETTTVCDAQWPAFNEDYLKEDVAVYAITFNGKVRFSLEFAAGTPKEEVEKVALAHENSQKYLEGKTPKKIIVVPGKLVNIVL